MLVATVIFRLLLAVVPIVSCAVCLNSSTQLVNTTECLRVLLMKICTAVVCRVVHHVLSRTEISSVDSTPREL